MTSSFTRSGLFGPILAKPIGPLAAAFGLGGALELTILTRSGLGLDPDSANYLSAASSVASSGTFHGFTLAKPFAVLSPLYPLLLVPGAALGHALTEARVLGAVVFGALVAVAVVGAGRITRSLSYSLCAGIATLVSVALLDVNAYVWSDGTFALAAALFLLTVTRVDHDSRAGFLSGVIAGAGTLTRYIGVTMVPVGVIAIAFWGRRRGTDLVAFLGPAILLPAAWGVRNVLVTSTFAGSRYSAAAGLRSSVHETAQTIGVWLHASHPLPALALAVLVFLVSLASSRRHRLSRLEVASLVFCGIYAAWLVISAASVALDPIGDRFLSALYVPIVWLAVGACSRLVSVAASRTVRVAVVVALVTLFVGWASFQARRIPDLSDYVGKVTLNAHPTWTASDEAKARRISSDLISNAPDAIYLRIGMRTTYAPRSHGYRSNEATGELHALRERLERDGPAVLVWFRAVHRERAYLPSQLATSFRLTRVGATSSATLYRVAVR